MQKPKIKSVDILSTLKLERSDSKFVESVQTQFDANRRELDNITLESAC